MSNSSQSESASKQTVLNKKNFYEVIEQRNEDMRRQAAEWAEWREEMRSLDWKSRSEAKLEQRLNNTRMLVLISLVMNVMLAGVLVTLVGFNVVP